MSCEQLSAIRQPSESPSVDYVFTEPPSIHSLQLQKSGPHKNAGKHQTSSKSPVHRHNVNESLKKKLGITHLKLPHALPPLTASSSLSSVCTANSPMISGVKTTSSIGTIKKFLSTSTTPCPVAAKKPPRDSRGPRGKYNKRENKKSNHHAMWNEIRDRELQQIPSDFWNRRTKVLSLTSLHMNHWYLPQLSDAVPCPETPIKSEANNDMIESVSQPRILHLSRDEQLELKRSELRRRMLQLKSAQRHRSILFARRRFLLTQASLVESQNPISKFPSPKSSFAKKFRNCRFNLCQNEALMFTVFCVVHLTSTDDQLLYAPCSMKLADNLLCSRVPLCDQKTGLKEEPRCHLHQSIYKKVGEKGQKRAKKGYKTIPRMVDTGKDQIVEVSGKKPYPYIVTILQTPNPKVIRSQKVSVEQIHSTTAVNNKSRESCVARRPKKEWPLKTYGQPDHKVKEEVDVEEDTEQEEVDSLLSHGRKSSIKNVGERAEKPKHIASFRRTVDGVGSTNQTDLLLVSENSSAYESSEDTGVGGLSESEMIEEIGFDSQFLEDPEFDNVLDDLLAVEQHGEIFESMSVDGDDKTMEMTGTSSFLGDFLSDQILSEDSSGATAVSVIVSSRAKTTTTVKGRTVALNKLTHA